MTIGTFLHLYGRVGGRSGEDISISGRIAPFVTINYETWAVPCASQTELEKMAAVKFDAESFCFCRKKCVYVCVFPSPVLSSVTGVPTYEKRLPPAPFSDIVRFRRKFLFLLSRASLQYQTHGV